MAELRFLSKIEQLAAFLRSELVAGRWEGAMPGRMELAAQLRLNERTVEEALRQLEREGVLVPQGAGRRRLIALEEKPVRTSLKVRILLLERIDEGLPKGCRITLICCTGCGKRVMPRHSPTRPSTIWA